MPKMAASFGEASRSAMRIDRSKIAVDVGLRAALGVGLCLVGGRLSGHTVAGVTATIGAISGGMASHQGTYRSRAGVVLVAGLAMGVCAAVGATVGHLLGVDVVVTAVIAFAAALMVCLGPAGMVVGIQAVVGLVVFSQFHFSLAVAVRNGGLVLLGAAVQALLVVLVWPLRRFSAERRALGGAFATLADFCRRAPAGEAVVLDPKAMDGLEAVWRDAQPFGGDEISAYRALAAQADRLRLEIVALVRAGQRFDRGREEVAARVLDEVMSTAAAVLDEVADAVREARRPLGWEAQRGRFRAAQEKLRAEVHGRTGWASAAALDAERRVAALAGQLRAVLRTAAVPAGAQPVELDEVMTGASAAVPAARSSATWARERVATLRSNLTLSSQACRHAARMAVTLAAAVALSHAFSFGHGYWLPMTAMLVLRPDFGSTVMRGISRVAGTLFGAGLVTLALAELKPSPDWLIVLVLLLCFPATSLVLANYAVYSVCIASLVVTLLAFTGNPELATAADRSFYTMMGAALAFAAYALWPTWEATSLRDTLSALAGTEGRYAGAVLRAWTEPAAADRAALQRVRLDARLARSNAEAAVTRWLAEPRRDAGVSRETVIAYMAAIRSCVQALLTLHAELPGGGSGRPDVAPLAGDVERALITLADSVKGSPPVSALPPLREEQAALARALDRSGSDPSTGAGTAVVLVGETDLLVDSIDAIGHLLGLVGPVG